MEKTDLGHVLWITWEKQIRNESISRMLDVELIEILCPGKVKRYVRSIAITLGVVFRQRPRVIIAQNPSIILNLLLLFVRPVFRFKLVTDAHYGGIQAYNGNFFLQKTLNYINASADLVIVTNGGHLEFVSVLGGSAFVLQDPLPDILDIELKGEEMLPKSIFFICSFAIDEPYEMVFDSFEKLADEGFRLFVSGNYKKVGIEPEQYPFISFLGYVAEDIYVGYLLRCSVVVDLTNWDNCLVCGAYEALSCNKPIVLSSHKALEEYFGSAAIYTKHMSEELTQAMRQAYLNREKMAKNAAAWKKDNESYMNERKRLLKQRLNELSSSAKQLFAH